MEIKKVLWPTDFSGTAEEALPYVTSLSKKYQTEIHVLYVIEQFGQEEPWYGDVHRSHINKLREGQMEKAMARLNQTCEKYLEGCPLYIKHTAVGDPANEILKFIGKEKVDMVVMATRGRRGHFRFGSVAEKVVKNSPVPVVTIPVDQDK